MSGNVNITDAGRRAIRNDTQLSADQALMLEIMNRVVDVTPDHLIEMFDELRAAYGGSEEATLAVKRGDVKFERVNP